MSRSTASRPTTQRLRIGPRLSGLLMTLEEFDALPTSALQRGYRYELIRGVLVVSPLPSNASVDPNEDLGYLLRLYQETHPQGSVLDATLPEQTILTVANRRRCDRAIWIGLGRLPVEEQDVPTIVVEFDSAARRDFLRDYQAKLYEYLEVGVREYWGIDRFQRIMTVFKPDPEDQARSQVVKELESYQTDLLPGFDLPLARLLAKADAWSHKRKRTPQTPAQGEN